MWLSSHKGQQLPFNFKLNADIWTHTSLSLPLWFFLGTPIWFPSFRSCYSNYIHQLFKQTEIESQNDRSTNCGFWCPINCTGWSWETQYGERWTGRWNFVYLEYTGCRLPVCTALQPNISLGLLKPSKGVLKRMSLFPWKHDGGRVWLKVVWEEGCSLIRVAFHWGDYPENVQIVFLS